MSNWHVFNDDVFQGLSKIADNSVNCVITSPPYWGLRNYQVKGQIGLERTPDEYVDKMVAVFSEVRRVLCNDSTLWLNLGDSYASPGKSRTAGEAVAKSTIKGSKSNTNVLTQPNKIIDGLKPKDLVGIPWRVALALQASGWYLRQDIIWHKPNPMPESVRDRCTKAHEYIFLFSKSANYVYNQDAIREQAPETVLSVPAGWDTDSGSHGSFHKDGRRNTINRNVQRSGLARALADDVGHNRSDVRTMGSRNKRSVWTVPTQPFPDAHFATFPPDLIRPCILAGSFPGGLVLDPFSGSGTTGVVCMEEGRRYVGIELNPDYVELSEKRIRDAEPQWFGEAAGL